MLQNSPSYMYMKILNTFHCQRTWSRKFSTARGFSMIKGVFHKQRSFRNQINFSWSRTFSTSRDFSINKEIFHDQGSFSQANILPQLRKFSTSKDFFLIMEVFFTIKDFSTIKNFLNVFEKYFDPLILGGNKRSFVFTERRSFYL